MKPNVSLVNSEDICVSYLKPEINLKRWNTQLGVDATMLDLEESFINIVNNIDHQIYGLVQRTKEDKMFKSEDQRKKEDFEFLEKKYKMNWKWLECLSQAVQKHLSNAAEYHMFYETLLEYSHSIPKIGLSQSCEQERERFEGNYEEANNIFHELKIYLSDYLTWWQKIEFLISQSRTISPIGLRLKSSDIKRPLTMLTDYKFNKVTIHKNEKVFLVQNETKQRWNIENTKGEMIINVPSICCELTPPDIEAIEDCILLRLKLLKKWTISMKDIGQVLMRYIATVLSYWTQIDMSDCANTCDTKENMYKSLYTMETLLNVYWKNPQQFLYLQNKINALRAELEITDAEDSVEDFHNIYRNTLFVDISPQIFESHFENSCNPSLSESETYIIQKRTIYILVNLYKELHKYWDTYRDFMDNPSLLTLIENIKTSPGNSEEMLIRSSDKLLKYLSVNDDTAWSNYLKLLAENEKTIKEMNSSDINLTNILPKTLDLQFPPNTFNYKSHFFNSFTERKIPAEKELCFLKSNSLPNPEKSSLVDIRNYFTSSLLPDQSHTLITSQEKVCQRNKDVIKSEFPPSINKTVACKLSSTMPNPKCRSDWNRDLYWQKNRIQPYYLVLSLPQKDKIMYVKDRRHRKSLSPSQAIKQGLADQNFLEVLDTETNIKYNFLESITKGLIFLVSSTNTTKFVKSETISDQILSKIVYKIDGILDPNKEEWINLKEAVSRNVLNTRSGQLKINTKDCCHIFNAIDMEIVRGKRIYNCNIKSLPKEITLDIPKSI